MIRGFTLLEVLIAVIVLTMGVMTVMWALSRGIYASATGVKDIDLALNIARANTESVFQSLKETDLTTLDIAAFETANSGQDPDFTAFDVTVDLTDIKGDASLMQADVTVDRDVAGGESSVTLTTLVAD